MVVEHGGLHGRGPALSVNIRPHSMVYRNTMIPSFRRLYASEKIIMTIVLISLPPLNSTHWTFKRGVLTRGSQASRDLL